MLSFFPSEKMCWDCEEFVDPITHRCYMKAIVNQDAGEHEAQAKPKKKKTGQRKRRRISEEMNSHEVEEDRQAEEGKNIYFST